MALNVLLLIACSFTTVCWSMISYYIDNICYVMLPFNYVVHILINVLIVNMPAVSTINNDLCMCLTYSLSVIITFYS